MAVRCDSQEIRIVEDSGFAKLVIRKTGDSQNCKTEERLSYMFLTYDGELSEVGNPERRRDGYVGGIAAGCHEHSPQPRMIMTRVKGPPTVFEVRFKPGTEVHRIRRGGNSDVA